MENFLKLLPPGYEATFGVTEMVNPGRLTEARLTAFTWSEQPGTVCLAVNKKYFKQAAKNGNIVAIICPQTAIDLPPDRKALIVAEKAAELFYLLHNLAIHRPQPLPPAQIAPTAVVSDSARIGAGVVIGESVVIGHHVAIHGPTVIGTGTIIDSGVVIGCSGLFPKHIDGKLTQVAHYGGVRIGRSCYIHSGVVIVRSANYGECTTLGDSVHIGVHSNIGHDSQIQDETVISSHAVIAGRARIGRKVWIGASVAVSNMVSVGDGARVNIGAVCLYDVPAGAEVSGNFALDHKDVMRKYLVERRDAKG